MATVELKEVKENLYIALKELGLSELESKLYTVSLLLGPSPIAALAKHLDISRPNIYKVIAGLEKCGLVKFSEKKRYARNFIVEPPAIVLEKVREKSESMEMLDNKLTSAMPELVTLYHRDATPTKIRVLEGEEQFREMFYRLIDETKDQTEFFGSAADIISFISWDKQNEFTKNRIAKGIKSRVLLIPSKEAEMLQKNDQKELRETRILRGANPFVTSFQIFANKVIIWQPKAPLALLIEDEYIVQMFRSIFYTLYDRSRNS